jgi:glucosamine-6-phosphate deaminase
MAFGENKAEAVVGAVEGPITASNPASILQMHPTAKIYLDEKSASKLARSDYCRWVFDNKPDWQRE